MPRKPRIISSTGIYHVILRSVNQQIIFEEDKDFIKYLFILSDCKTKFDVDIFAYCLMDNHIHLLLHSAPDSLSNFFQSVGSRFVHWYNAKYKRYGHLFQERFHSKPVENDEYYLTTLIYIHNNPVTAGLCKLPSEYHWSSYNAFYGEKNNLLTLSFSYEIAGSKDALQHYFAANSNRQIVFPQKFDLILNDHYLTDEYALKLFKSITQLDSPFEIVNLSKAKRNEYIRILRSNRLSISQISRITGISTSTVKRLTKD